MNDLNVWSSSKTTTGCYCLGIVLDPKGLMMCKKTLSVPLYGAFDLLGEDRADRIAHRFLGKNGAGGCSLTVAFGS